MFYDERIEFERGRIARNGILLATLYALLCGALRWVNVFLNIEGTRAFPKSHYYLPVYFEATVLLLGIACLVAGALCGRGTQQDERTAATRAAFWSRAGRYMLYGTLGAFALLYPLSLCVATNINYAAVDTAQVALNLFLLLAAYLAFAFKERDIYFNYAAQESPLYGRAVLKSIGRLALLLLGCLGLSVCGAALGEVLLHSSRTSKILLCCLLLWSLILLMTAATYAIFSALERLSYLKKHVLSGATFIALLLVILLRAAYTTAEALLANSGATMTDQLIALNYFAWLPLAAGFWFVLFLIYFYHEYRESGRDRPTRVGYLLILGAEVLGGLADFLLSVFQMIFHRSIIENIEQNLLFGKINGWLSAFTYLVFLTGFLLLVVGPVRRGLAGRGHLAVAVLLSAAALGVEIFLYTQIDAVTLLLVSGALTLVRYLYLLIFLKHAAKKLDYPKGVC